VCSTRRSLDLSRLAWLILVSFSIEVDSKFGGSVCSKSQRPGSSATVPGTDRRAFITVRTVTLGHFSKIGF